MSPPYAMPAQKKKLLLDSAPVSAQDMMYGNPFRTIEQMTEAMTEKLERRREQQKERIEQKRKRASLSKRVIAGATRSKRHEPLEKTPLHLAVAGYISYIFLFLVGYIREAIYGLGPIGKDLFVEKNRDGYTPLFSSFESFYSRNVYRRLKHVFNRPISSVPGATVSLVDHCSDDHFWSFKMNPSKSETFINLASYNYLGFAESNGPVNDAVEDKIRECGLTSSSSSQEIGTRAIHDKLEKTVAKFIGTEDAITLGMGFATNTLNIPRLFSKGTLLLSDDKNHASLILGMRLSGATVMVFKHNSVENLEKILRRAILQGQPRTRRPWKKIVVVVEGVYSMEGTIVRLPEIVALKKKYGIYIYLDEAHSVGALGPNGRGVVDYFGLNPRDIDIMMGTFTKSFGAAGGYIAGSYQLISYLRANSQAFVYAPSMSPPVAQQVISAMNSIMDQEQGDGMERVRTLARNSRYFRQKLQQMGLIVYGHDDSPVVPVMLYMPAKIGAFVTSLFEHKIASVSVGFPATKMTEERARFCISASHTQAHLDQALEGIRETADHLHIRYSKKNKYREAEIVY